MEYNLMYCTTLFVSFSLTLILYLYHRRYWDPVTHVPLQNIYLLNMTSAVMCVIWCLTDGKPELSTVNCIANIIEFNCMGFSGYFWVRYCSHYQNIPLLKNKKVQILIALPVTVVALMILSSPWTHWAFYIDDAGYFQRGSIYFIQQTSYLYLLVCSVVCLKSRNRCTTSGERRHLSVLAMFPLSPAFFGSIQILAPSGVAPTLQFSILISLLMVFVDELDQKITRDSLTQLTNHYEFDRILHNRMGSIVQKHGARLFLFMCDLDDFKSINDSYGHLQGDEALRIVGSVLNKTGIRHNAICARMSGDEFMAFMETQNGDEARSFMSDLKNSLAEACRDLPYTLGISIGYAEYDGNMTLRQLLGKADADMYQQKRLNKKSGSSRN